MVSMLFVPLRPALLCENNGLALVMVTMINEGSNYVLICTLSALDYCCHMHIVIPNLTVKVPSIPC